MGKVEINSTIEITNSHIIIDNVKYELPISKKSWLIKERPTSFSVDINNDIWVGDYRFNKDKQKFEDYNEKTKDKEMKAKGEKPIGGDMFTLALAILAIILMISII